MARLSPQEFVSRLPTEKGVRLLELPEKFPRASTGITNSYIHASYGEFRENSEYFREIGKLLPRKAAGSALDLGCGVGRIAFELAKRHRFAIGVDRDFSMLGRAAEFSRKGRIEYSIETRKLARRKIIAGFRPGKNAAFVLGDALSLPFPDGSFGTVFAGNLLDSVSDPRRLLSEIGRMLSPGGALILTTPFCWKDEVTLKENWLETKASPGEVVLRKFLEKTGYSIEKEIPRLDWALPARERMKTVFSVYSVRARKA